MSLYAEQGSAERLWVPKEVRADGLQLGDGVSDEPHASVDIELPIPCLILGEPLSVVVPFQLGEEFEEFWREVGRGFLGHSVPFFCPREY